MPTAEEVLVLSFGTAFAASVVLFLFSHHHSERAKHRMHHAESRLHHTQELLEESALSLRSARKSLRGKASMRHAEEKISRTISELLSALEEKSKIEAHVRKRK